MRKRMENYEEPAPDGLWDDIERVIDARKTPVILQPAKPPVWKRVTAVAAMLAIAITCTLFLLLHTDAPTSLPTDTPATTHTLHAQRECRHLRFRPSNRHRCNPTPSPALQRRALHQSHTCRPQPPTLPLPHCRPTTQSGTLRRRPTQQQQPANTERNLYFLHNRPMKRGLPRAISYQSVPQRGLHNGVPTSSYRM